MALSNRIWWTHKARIQAAGRLRATSTKSEWLLTWYSFCSVASSIYFLSVIPSTNIPLVAATIFSVLVLILSLLVSNQDYKSRAIQMKQCYLQLGRLYREAKKLETESQGHTSQLQAIEDQYQSVIEASENHSEFDYNYAIWKLSQAEEEIDKTISNQVRKDIRRTLFIRNSFWFIVYLFPLVIVYWLIFVA